MARLVRIDVYPVKGMREVTVDRIAVDPCGLAGDRRWMVVDESGRFHTQRDLPVLATIDARPVEGGLVLSARRNERELRVLVAFPGADAPLVDVVVWRSIVAARVASDEASAFLGEVCGRPCRLVYLDDPTRRATNPEHSLPGDRVSFADGYPVSIANLASFDDLVTRLPAPIEVERFRANLQVEGFAVHAEDRWRRLRVGAATFRVAKPIDRCVVTTLDPRTGEASKGALSSEPLRTLATYRRWSGSVFFATHLLPDAPGSVAVGDDVQVLEEGPLWH